MPCYTHKIMMKTLPIQSMQTKDCMELSKATPILHVLFAHKVMDRLDTDPKESLAFIFRYFTI